MPRAAPPAPSTADGRASELQTGQRCSEAVHEARTVGVVGNKFVALEPQRVGGAGSAGRGPCFGRCREGRLLVRQRDIAAGEALVAQSAQKTGDVIGLNRMAHIAAVDAVALQPIAMDQRRARMRRPASR